MQQLDLDDEMPYGRYQGLLVSHVCSIDRQYIRWFAFASETYEFTDEIVNAMDDCIAMQELLYSDS